MTSPHLPNSDAIALSELNPDEAAKGVLSLFRYYLTSFADPESQAWQMALATAIERWGEIDGLQTAMAALEVIQAVRRIRPTPFHFANPLCLACRSKVTADEAALIRMIQAMRRDDTRTARAHLANVTLGRMDPALIRTGLALAQRLGSADMPRPKRATHEGLAHVH